MVNGKNPCHPEYVGYGMEEDGFFERDAQFHEAGDGTGEAMHLPLHWGADTVGNGTHIVSHYGIVLKWHHKRHRGPFSEIVITLKSCAGGTFEPP
ncbi:hypothetical protein [Methanoculleus taiwanensis]|uniref:hypothetical protein n=1 Tax=Methanoculleus taiwanensis TaxID=1550565 RepID=UPI000FFF36BE|nr:hypothetical protein [Methanoculleus taiwanensis]